MSDTSRLARFGATVGVATLGSLLAAAPGGLRLSSAADLDVARAWLTLAGLLLLPMLLLVPLARLARAGLRGVAPGNDAFALERVAAAAVFVCTWLWLLSALGASLREKTHQRALGAVTFAVLAIASLAFLALVSRRLVVILAALKERHRDIGTVVAAAVTVLSLMLLGLRVARAAPDLTVTSRATLVDGLAIALSVAFMAQKTFENRRILAWVGPPAAVCVFIVAMHTLTAHATALAAIEHACPVYFALIRGFAYVG